MGESESFVKFINLVDSVLGFLSVLDTALRAKVLVQIQINFKAFSCSTRFIYQRHTKLQVDGLDGWDH